jgi:hypothetical protein
MAYCEEFGLSSGPHSAEETYLEDFVTRYSQPGWSGYKVVLALHQQARHPLFKAARDAADDFHIADTSAEAAQVEAQLRDANRTLMTFVNQSAFSGLQAKHSIAVIEDAGLWHFDANNGRLQRSANTLGSLGVLGEGILFAGLIPARTAATA